MTIQNISRKLASNVSYIIIAFSILAFFHPTLFFWANSYSAALLGVAMFGMGLTISVEDFKILCKRPREITIGCIAQYTIMPALAYCLSKVFYLPPDIALGVILVGCCQQCNYLHCRWRCSSLRRDDYGFYFICSHHDSIFSLHLSG